MAAGPNRLRATAALALGALALHQLRYLLGFGGEAAPTLAAHGHGYLSLFAALVAVLAATALGQLVAAVARAERTGEAVEEGRPLGLTWLAATVALLAAYTAQELTEAALANGHPTGVAALLAGGGWWALPLAIALGLLVTLALRSADAAITAAAARAGHRARACRPAADGEPAAVALPKPRLIARNLAGRAPPVLAP